MSVEVEQLTVGAGEHVVQLYDRDQDLVGTVGAYLLAALRAGEVAIVIATHDHRQALEQQIRASGVDLDAARRRGTFVDLDAAETLATFLVDGAPNPDAFRATVGKVVERACASGRPVRAFGEMVALLWEEGHVTAAMDLEVLWNDLGADFPFSLFCAYRVDSTSGSDLAGGLGAVCRLHSAVIAADATGEETCRFERGADAPGRARRFVVAALRRWGRYELVDDAAVVATELATNAVLHARSTFDVTVSCLAGTIRISVHDRSPQPPVPRPRDLLAESGRGVGLLAGLGDTWGTDVHADGKVVWVDLCR